MKSLSFILSFWPELVFIVLVAFAAWKLSERVKGLRASEKNYRELVENVNSIVLRWLADGTIIYINEYGLRLLGFQRQELLGRSILETIVPSSESDGRDLTALMADLAENPEKYAENENENLCRDGRRIWVAWSNRPIFNKEGKVLEILSIGSDHTRRREVEQALQQSESRFRSMVEHIQEAVYRCTLDLPWRVEFISNQIERITGYPAADFMEGRRTFVEVVHPADREVLALKVQKAVGENEPFTVEYRILAADGSMRWVHERGRAIKNQRGELGLEGGILAVTEQKQTESRLRRAHKAANAASKAKSAFLANMSHELRTPLNAIIGYSEILLEELQAEEHRGQVEDLEKIRSAAKHLQEMISEVLDFSKTEAGKMRLEPEECQLDVLLLDLVEVVKPLAEEQGNKLTVEISKELGRINVDPTRLRQVLYNLLGNAAKFTENGTITLRARRVYWDGEEWAQFDVQDTGIGIDEEQQRRLFKPFSQADDSITRRFGGTGLGLAISRYFCRMMGGEIGVNSVPDVGSTFTVSLPVTDRPQCGLINEDVVEDSVSLFG
mgnify:CR=1 FL=1